MRSYIKFITSIFLLFTLPVLGFSQNNKVFVSGGSGIIYYSGDLSDKALPYAEQIHPIGYASIGYNFTPTFYTTFGMFYGRVSGADSLSSINTNRDYHFRSSLFDAHLLLGLNTAQLFRNIFKDGGIKKRFDHLPFVDGPKLFAGGGIFHFNPEAKYNGNWNKLKPLGTEGQNLKGDYPSPYSLWQFNLKVGGEIGFRVSRKIQIDIYAIYNILFTDYLDDISGTFPDNQELLDSPRGLLASKYTYRFKDGSIPAKGAPRGNPDINDSYTVMGIKLTYNLSKAQLDLIRHK